MKIYYVSIWLLLSCVVVYSQSTIITPGDIGNNIQATSQKGGIQFPNMSYDSIKAITPPVSGTVVFDKDNKCLRVYNGSFWERLNNTNGSGIGEANGDFKLWQDIISLPISTFQPTSILLTDMVADTVGNLYVCGQITGRFSFSGTLINFVPPDAGFLAKYASNGTLMWIRKFLPSEIQMGFVRTKRLTYDKFTYCVVICGDYVQTATLQGTSSNLTISTPSPINFGAFVAKYDTEGNILWAKGEYGVANTSSNITANGVTIGTNGDIYFCGSIRGTLDSSPSGTITSGDNNTDILLYKYDANGSRIWAKDLGITANSEKANSIAFKNNKLYVTGSFLGANTTLGTIAINTGMSGDNCFIMRASTTNGDAEWATYIAGPNNDTGTDIVADNNGQLYITGTFGSSSSNNATFGTTNGTMGSINSTNNSIDYFVVRYKNTGEYINAFKIGSIDAEENSARLTLDSQGNIYFSGSPKSPFYVGGIAVNGFGSTEGLIAKFDNQLNLQWQFAVNGYGIDNAIAVALTTNNWVYALCTSSNIAYLNQNTINPAQGTMVLVRYRE